MILNRELKKTYPTNGDPHEFFCTAHMNKGQSEIQYFVHRTCLKKSIWKTSSRAVFFIPIFPQKLPVEVNIMWESAFNQKLTFNKPTSIFESSILGMGTEPLGSSVIS